MRVLMTADAVGGVWTYALDLARALAPLGVDVVLATMGPRPNGDQRAEVARLSNVTLIESDYRLEWMDDPWADVDRAGEWLLRLEDEHAPDVVHVNGYAHGAVRFRAPVVVVAHSCVCSWFSHVKGEEAGDAWQTYRARVQRGLRAANHVVGITRAMLEDVRRHYGFLPATSVIHNGRDAALFRSAQKKEPMVFAAGRIWDEAKNLRALERVASRLSWPVYLAGDEAPPQGDVSVETSAQRLGRLSLEQVAGWMARASIYAFPAKYEPFGLSVLEAALAGCALVVGDLPSLREVWGHDALYVDPRDDDALARTLDELARNDEVRAELARRAALRATHYDIARTAAAYRDLYRELADQQAVLRGPESPRGGHARCAS